MESESAARWEHPDDSVRVFISHVSEEGDRAMRLKQALDWFGLDGFVAHLDIEPGMRWAAEIAAALGTCDALVAILTEDFPRSAWCDQEVGWALGRGIPVVPVRVHVNPYGFFGSFQAIRWAELKEPRDVAGEVHGILSRDPTIAARCIEGVVTRLERVQGYHRANALAKKLLELEVRLTPTQLQRLERAAESNDQIRGAWDVPRALETLRRRGTG